MTQSVWRQRAPLWLRILAGVLVLPFIAMILFVANVLLELDASVFWLFVLAPALAWLIAFRTPTPVAAALSVLGVLFLALPMYYGEQASRTFEDIDSQLGQAPGGPSKTYPYESHADEALPRAEAPAPEPEAPVGGYGKGPGGGGGSGSDGRGPGSPGEDQFAGGVPLQPPLPPAPLPQPAIGEKPPAAGADQLGQLPEFPWPPPSASTSYVLPDRLFATDRTVGEAIGAILAALERNGYVERSFFRTAPGGVALVTRLERINGDGSPSAEAQRWPAAAQPHASTRSLMEFLQGLFFVDPGHYRVIVFVLQDLPFAQSAETITAPQAHAWLVSGANVLSPQVAALPFAGSHVTVLIYEFASDGSSVKVVTSELTGKQHLERAGLLAVLDKAQ